MEEYVEVEVICLFLQKLLALMIREESNWTKRIINFPWDSMSLVTSHCALSSLGTKQCGKIDDFPPVVGPCLWASYAMTGCDHHTPPPPLPLPSHPEPLAAKDRARGGLKGKKNPVSEESQISLQDGREDCRSWAVPVTWLPLASFHISRKGLSFETGLCPQPYLWPPCHWRVSQFRLRILFYP